jgi:hypothetical protein
LALDVVGVHQLSGGSLPVAHRVNQPEVFAKVSDFAQQTPRQR